MNEIIKPGPGLTPFRFKQVLWLKVTRRRRRGGKQAINLTAVFGKKFYEINRRKTEFGIRQVCLHLSVVGGEFPVKSWWPADELVVREAGEQTITDETGRRESCTQTAGLSANVNLTEQVVDVNLSGKTERQLAWIMHERRKAPVFGTRVTVAPAAWLVGA